MSNLRIRKPRTSKRLNRILLATVLVLASGFGAVRLLGIGQPVFLVATKTIAAGDRITIENTKLAPVDLQGVDSHYLVQFAPKDSFATETIGPGELIPKRLLGDGSQGALVSISLELSGPLSSTVVEGRKVDLWSAGGSTFESVTSPRMLAARCTVRSIVTTTALSKTTSTVELAMNPEYLDAVLAAQASKHYLTLVVTS